MRPPSTHCPEHHKWTTGCADCTRANTRYRKWLRMQPTGARVPAIGTQRRIRGLARDGWSFAAIGAHLDVTGQSVQHYNDDRKHLVSVHTHAAVAALFDKLAGTTGPSPVTAIRAAGFGWVPAMHWDDPDDPNERPDKGWADTRHDLDVTDVIHLVNQGAGWEQLTDSFDIQKDSIALALRRHGHHEVLTTLHRRAIARGHAA